MKNSYSLRTPMAGLDYYGECRPARETAWDFFEFMPLDRHSLVCSVGRINGRGITAAFTMASLQAFLHSLTRHHRGSFAAVVRDLNRTIYEIAPDSFYASLFYARVDPERAQLHYVSAGHGPVMLLRRGETRLRRLENTGTVLGLSLRVDFRERTVDLQPGDLILAMTDGVTDVLADDQILRILEGDAHLRPFESVRAVLDAACDSEDRTAAAIRFDGRGETRLFEVEEAVLAGCAA
jgi:sigma-B regulation protein RsbU (phosphoserine phosphatase)